ncbi:MAG: hypothetical protein K2J08_09895, partial [Ruminococcus sp.]|nr:hypothetical protein [Ruminococcus sp.]
LKYDSLFSFFPDIDVTFPDIDGNRNNLVVIQQPPDPATTYPVATSDINVNVEVDVTFPPEFYDKYPPLDTTPSFIAENPDVDFALDSPLPLEILETSGNILAMATDIINDSGLMPFYLMCISLGLVAFFLL